MVFANNVAEGDNDAYGNVVDDVCDARHTCC